MKRVLVFMVTIAFTLAGCSSGQDQDSRSHKTPGEENKPLSLTKEIEVEVEGMKEKRPAELQQSSNGYHFYMLDHYLFEKENVTTEKVAFANDPMLYATIEKLDKTADLETLKKNSLELAEQVGDASELKEGDIYFPYFHDAKFFVKGISEKYDVVMYLVKEVEGQLFYFSLHIPSKTEAEGVEPSLWAMLETVKPN